MGSGFTRARQTTLAACRDLIALAIAIAVCSRQLHGRQRCIPSRCAAPLPAARRRRRRASSITRRSDGRLARSSRQTRCPARAMAAGIVAASMARRCQSPSKKWTWFFSTRQAATSEGWWGTLPGEVKEGIGPQGQGGTRARKSPPPSLLRPSLRAIATTTTTASASLTATATATAKQPNTTATADTRNPNAPDCHL